MAKKAEESKKLVVSWSGIRLQGADLRRNADFVAGFFTGCGWLGKGNVMVSTSGPCGKRYSFANPEEFPLENMPCECGDPTHWVVHWADITK